MGFAAGIAYSVVGVVVSLLFFIGVLLQAFGSFYVGVAFVAIALLIHAAKEAWIIWGVYRKKKPETFDEKDRMMVQAGLIALSGLLGFAFIFLFKGVFGKAWGVFLVNDAVVTLAYLLPALVKVAICVTKE